MTSVPKNTDPATVEGFGREWTTFSQSERDLTDEDRRAIFESYFAIFPWDRMPPQSVGADIGCGSGRWAMLVAPRVGTSAPAVDARRRGIVGRAQKFGRLRQCHFSPGVGIGACRFDDDALDFAYSLGVLHHVPDTAQAIRDIGAKLKPGAPFLTYLNYAFDNRSAAYRMLWKISNAGRLNPLTRALPGCSSPRRPSSPRLVYWPLARMAALLEKFGLRPRSWPLSVLPPPHVLRDAHRRLRPLLHAAGAALHAGADQPTCCGAAGFRRHQVFGERTVLGRGGDQKIEFISSR